MSQMSTLSNVHSGEQSTMNVLQRTWAEIVECSLLLTFLSMWTSNKSIIVNQRNSAPSSISMKSSIHKLIWITFIWKVTTEAEWHILCTFGVQRFERLDEEKMQAH